MSNESRCLGLVGGLGPGATITYYRALTAAHAAQNRVARMLIAHADLNRVLALAGANDLDNLAQYLARVIRDSGRAARRSPQSSRSRRISARRSSWSFHRCRSSTW